jgi:hypothetical protein
VFISEPNDDFDRKIKSRYLILPLKGIDRLELNLYVYAVKDTPKPTTLEAEVSNMGKGNSSCSVTTFMREFTSFGSSIRGMGKHFARNL